MLRYVPYALGVIVLAGTTWWQAKIVDRWGGSEISKEELQEQFARVPHEMGDWTGVDEAVEEEVKKTAGAVAHVNRVYKNAQTGDEVHLWLIAGHAKDIVRHTPDVCYPSQGYRQTRDEVAFEMATADGSKAVFWTTVFIPEADSTPVARRVYWAWAINPGEGGDARWESPSSARRRFGNTRALYKMYFTTLVTSRDETAANSPCTEFARICIPEVNRALFGGGRPVQAPPPSEADEPPSEEFSQISAPGNSSFTADPDPVTVDVSMPE